ncbi:MAG: AhpC/TSA family protein [Bacteroidales bacterium]|nr:AhpC/TSA family protein [Bacteroidales bacterium]
MLNSIINKYLKNILYIVALLIFTNNKVTSQEQLKTGSKAPEIKAIDHDNNTFVLREKLKEGPVVLLFYRGEWCKYCNLYMHDLADSLSFVTDMGANVVAITPESNEYIDITIEKSKATFSIIYDEEHKIMDDYKVTWHVSKFANFFYKLSGKNLNKANNNSDRALPVPATYIIDKDGTIKGGYFNENYTKRMPVSEIIKVLKTI